jgi:hypothetical protein
MSEDNRKEKSSWIDRRSSLTLRLKKNPTLSLRRGLDYSVQFLGVMPFSLAYLAASASTIGLTID